MLLPWYLCGVLLVVIILLLIKIVLLKKSINEIGKDFSECLSTETNQLISVASNDRHIRHLAVEINEQLRLLRSQRQQYLKGNRELKEAVTNISHDLRTPLTAICGYMELLEEEEQSASVAGYLEVISNRVEMLKHLTEELFKYSVIIAVESSPIKERVILNDLLAQSMAQSYVALTARQITPEIQMPSNKIIRYLSPSDLSRIFSNLLNNAIKYSDGDLEITLAETGEITFTNTASNLNELQVGKLFDRFYTVQTAQKSTGLGLAITRTLTEQMGGTITAEYKDKRLSICITLPEQEKLVKESFC